MRCHLCGKLLWQGNAWMTGIVTVAYFTSSSTSLESPYCTGHISVECPTCKWMVPLGYHSEEDCNRIRGILGVIQQTQRASVPQAFLDAFKDEEILP